MSKAIQGVAMLGAAVGMGAVAFFNPALIFNDTFDRIWGAMILGGISSEVGAIADALTSNRGMSITSRQAAAYRQVILGTQRVGGVIIYRSTTGSTHNQLNYIIVLAGHTCHSIEALYLDGRKVYWDTSSHGNSTRNGVNFGGHAAGGDHVGPDGTKYNFGDDLVYCEARYGDQVDGDVITSMTANDPVWAAGSDGRSPWVGGCTYVYLKIRPSSKMFPAEPEIRFTVNGADDIYDPRIDASGWSNNWALCMAWLLTNKRYGLSAVYGADVNTAQLIAAANICEEPVPLASGLTEARYLIGWHYDTATAPGDAMQQLLSCAAGRISFVGGEWYIWPAAWTEPEFEWDESALTGPIQQTPVLARRDLGNRYTGVCTAPNWPYNQAGNLYDQNGWYDGTREDTFSLQFQPTSIPAYSRDTRHGYASAIDLEADGGRVLVKDVDLRACLSIAQAQRVLKILYMRNRLQYSATYPMVLPAWQMQPNTCFTFRFERLGLAKTLEVENTRFSVQPPQNRNDSQVPAFLLEFDVRETGPEIYEWSVVEEQTIYSVPAITQVNSPYNVAAPTGLALATTTSTGKNTGLGGNSTNYALVVTFMAPADALVTQVQLRAKLHSNADWIEAGTVGVDSTGDTVSSVTAYIYGVNEGDAYDVQARAVRANGAVSDWAEVDSYTV